METFSQVHSTELGQFLKLWGNWVAEKGKPVHLFSPIFNLTFGVLGVGSLEPNEGADQQDEGPVTKDEAWRQLLTDEVPPSLKKWTEVSALKANKSNIGLALREYMRQAWGGCLFVAIFLI